MAGSGRSSTVARYPGPAVFRFDRRWVFAVAPEELWTAICEPDEFPRWWRWLRAVHGDGLVEGGRSRCVVRGPVPYRLRFTVEVCHLMAPRLVDARVGDLEGPARLELSPHPEGTSTRLWWEVQLRRPLLRAAARLTRPVMEWGHDRVVHRGAEQFRRRALRV